MIECIRGLSTVGYGDNKNMKSWEVKIIFCGIHDENKGSIQDQQRVEMKSKKDRYFRKRRAFSNQQVDQVQGFGR